MGRTAPGPRDMRGGTAAAPPNGSAAAQRWRYVRRLRRPTRRQTPCAASCRPSLSVDVCNEVFGHRTAAAAIAVDRTSRCRAVCGEAGRARFVVFVVQAFDFFRGRIADDDTAPTSYEIDDDLLKTPLIAGAERAAGVRRESRRRTHRRIRRIEVQEISRLSELQRGFEGPDHELHAVRAQIGRAS